MKLVRLAGTCNDGKTCPAVFETDRGSFVVQGWEVSDEEALASLRLPSGESAVEIPAELVEVLLRAQ